MRQHLLFALSVTLSTALFGIGRSALASPDDAKTATNVPLGVMGPGDDNDGWDDFMALGSVGDDVKQVQHDLNVLDRAPRNLPLIAEDGQYGPATAEAVASLQALVGLPVTGVRDDTTQSAIESHSQSTTLTAASLGIESAPRTTPDNFVSAADGKTPVIVHTLAQPVTVSPPAPGLALTVRPYAFTAGMKLDFDGVGALGKKNPGVKSTTTLLWGGDASDGGEGLDTAGYLWVTLPASFAESFPGTRPGDLVAVIHGGRVVYAQIANIGGADGQLGEGSVNLAHQFPDLVAGPLHDGKGLDPTTGGDSNLDVTYLVFPGSGNEKLIDDESVAKQGAKLLAQLTPAPETKTIGITGELPSATQK